MTYRYAERPVCETCGTWRCSDCGHKRSNADRRYPDPHCPRCKSRKGEMLPVRHSAPQKCAAYTYPEGQVI